MLRYVEQGVVEEEAISYDNPVHDSAKVGECVWYNIVSNTSPL